MKSLPELLEEKESVEQSIRRLAQTLIETPEDWVLATAIIPRIRHLARINLVLIDEYHIPQKGARYFYEMAEYTIARNAFTD